MRDKRALPLWLALACIVGAFAIGHYRPPYEPRWILAASALVFAAFGCCVFWFAREALRSSREKRMAMPDGPYPRPQLSALLDHIEDGQVVEVSITVGNEGLWEIRGYDHAKELICLALACPHHAEAATPAYRPVLILHGAGRQCSWGEIIVDNPREALLGMYEAAEAGRTDIVQYFH